MRNSFEQLADETFLELNQPPNYLSSELCQDGHYYWGAARSIGEIAICHNKPAFVYTTFTGLREKMGSEFLFDEIHYDQDDTFGTYRPLLDLGEAPTFKTEAETMDWLLDQTLNFVETRINWLKAMPSWLKIAQDYSFYLEDDIAQLETLQQLKREGFNNRPKLSFKEILAKKKDKDLGSGSA
jgi:hypothetical protein